MDLEIRYWQAIKDKDVETALSLTDDPCIITGPQGVGRVDNQQLAEMLRTAPYSVDSFELKDDVQVRMLSDDVAVLAYEVHEELTLDGQPITLEAADTSTWVRRGDRWRCAIHTEALSGDPYGRAITRPRRRS